MAERLADPRAQAPKSRRGCFVLVALTVATLLVGLAYVFIVLPLMQSPTHRKDLVDFSHLVNLGEAPAAVEGHFYNGLGRRHSLILQRSSEVWVAYTPWEFGGRNWVLVISFGTSGVEGIGVRTSGNSRYHPPDAPVDLVAEGAEVQWRNRFGTD